jgi:hypothetical protein
MKKALLFFLFVPMISISMESEIAAEKSESEEEDLQQQTTKVSTPNMTELRKSLLLLRVQKQEPTAEITQGDVRKKIPSDGELSPKDPKFLKISGELALGRLSDEEFEKKSRGSLLERRKSMTLAGEKTEAKK